MVSPEVVEALYSALLGYLPDPLGLEHWQSASSIEDVVLGLIATQRFRDRAAAIAGEDLTMNAGADLVKAGWRLEYGRGLVELVDLAPTIAAHTALELLPWEEICLGIPAAKVRVLGRYAVELADELGLRADARRIDAGLADDWARPGHGPDVLVLTGGEDLLGLGWGHPELIRAVRQRLVVPTQIDPQRPADELATLRNAARRRLHCLGFTEVHHVFRRRHGGGLVRIDTSYSTPSFGVLDTIVHVDINCALVPASTWFVANRASTEITG